MEDSEKYKLFQADVYNSVCEYYNQGLQNFEGCIIQDDLIPGPIKQNIHQGLRSMSNHVSAKLLSSLSYFEQSSKSCYLKSTRLTVDQLKFKELQDPSMLSTEFGEIAEKKMAEKIAQLHQEIAKGCAECSSISRRIREADERIAQLSEPAEYTALSETLSIHKDSIQAIARMSLRIQDLLARGHEMKARARPAAVPPPDEEVADVDDIMEDDGFVLKAKATSLESLKAFKEAIYA